MVDEGLGKKSKARGQIGIYFIAFRNYLNIFVDALRMQQQSHMFTPVS